MRTRIDPYEIMCNEFGALQKGESKPPSYSVWRIVLQPVLQRREFFIFSHFLCKRKFGLFKPKTKTERKKTAYTNAVLVVAEVGLEPTTSGL